MSGGLAKTFATLAATRNEAATRVLIAALDSPNREVQTGALKALVQRRSSPGHRELLRRWNTLGPGAKAAVAEQSGRVSGAVRDAILSTDKELAANGLDAVLCFREFDLVPTLLIAAEDKGHPNAKRAAQAVLSLAEMLYDELAAPRDYRNRRDPQLVRQYVVGTLENAMQRFEHHRRTEIAEAFLLLAKHDDPVLKRILQDPHDKAFLKIVNLLSNSPRPGVQRLLLNYLDDRYPPTAIHNVLARRRDIPFLRHLLQKLDGELPKAVKMNLKRIDSFSWLDDDLHVLAALNEEEQAAVVRLVMEAGINRLKVFDVIRFLVERGGPAARRAAAGVLSEFRGAEANELILGCVGDEDAEVQTQAVMLLRERGIPGAMQRLIDCLDSPHESVRRAARECLAEFKFARFLSTFDMLDDEVACSTGQLVKRVDLEAMPQLRKEVCSPSRTRRFRALRMAVAMQAVPDLEPEIVQILSDPDHLLRAEAARVLQHSDSPLVRKALRECLLDRSTLVQEAAERTLQAFVEAAAKQGRNIAEPQPTVALTPPDEETP